MFDMKDMKKALAETAKRGFENGLFAGTSGNLSIFMREKNLMLITPSGVRYENMTADDIVAVDMNGNVLDGHYKPSSEWRMHAVVYESFDGINGIVHTHSPYATAFAVAHKAIPPTLIEMHFFLGGAVECAKYATPGTEEVGLNALPVLKGKGGCLMENHGVLAVGKDIDEAYLRAEYIEDAAKIYTFASQIGEPVTIEKL